MNRLKRITKAEKEQRLAELRENITRLVAQEKGLGPVERLGSEEAESLRQAVQTRIGEWHDLAVKLKDPTARTPLQRALRDHVDLTWDLDASLVE